MRAYHFVVSGQGWTWEESVEAECVSDAVKEAAGVLADLVSCDGHEVPASDGEFMVFVDDRVTEWLINGQECEVDDWSLQELASESESLEVQVVTRSDFVEPKHS